MNFIKRNVIKYHSDLIIKDLHGDVIEMLKDKGVITSIEYENINSQNKQEERNEKFLEILYTKPEGFNPFLESLKDWYWWIEKNLKNSLTKRPSTVDEAIALSKVPAIPRINVSRKELLNEVREALKNLKRGDYVVLRGMSGCGKSSLAAEALHDRILLDCFGGRVVWLSCGHDIKDDENEVLALQIELNATIFDEELVNDVKTATIKSLRLNLQKRFSNTDIHDFYEGLVVLDDVNSPHVIEALRIGCKTLVTTTDEDVMKNQGGRWKDIKVSESFKEEETMQYLAQCVDVSVDKLPPQAAEIHKHGKGHPLIMSLIGADLRDHRDESRHHEENWQAWLDVLVKREYGELKRRSFSNEPLLPQTIKICISNLEPEMREKYQDFALFVEDVNIKIEVLEVLWNLPKMDVKKIMNELCSKSLVVRKYNEGQKSYVYGIHDLLRFYLREQLNENDLKNLHRKLINRYLEACNRDLSQLPRDNYFLYYIGYHIANSKEYALFTEWYFNLNFIEAKLKVAGPGDLLLDYKRYGPHFIEGFFDKSALSKRLADFVRFVEVAGLDVRRNNGPDIVQLALQEPHDSDVYKTALTLAQTRPQNTYLRFQLGPSKSKAAPHTIQTREKVSAACFTNNENHLIVAFESGTIQIVHLRGHKLREYEGHSSRVTGLSVSLHKNVFLSVSDSFVKIWQLPDLDFTVSNGDFGDRSPSPSQRQDHFEDIFNKRSPDKRKSWFDVKCSGPVWACFSPDGSRFAVCSMKEHKVDIFQITKPEHKEAVKEPWFRYQLIRLKTASSAAFSADNTYIALGSGDCCRLVVHDLTKNEKESEVFKKFLSFPILTVFSLPGIKFGVLTRSNLSVWDQSDDTPVPYLKDYTKGECEEYTFCAAAADGSVIAVATSNGKILICDPSDGSVIREIHESSANIKYLAMDGTKERRLLACYDDSTIRVWKLGEVHSQRHATMRSNFVITWTQDGKSVLVAPTLKSSVKRIIDLTKSEDLPVGVNGDINICGVSDCGRYIVVGTPGGGVFLHREGDETMYKLMSISKDSINKLNVKKIKGWIFVVIGLKRTIRVWTCKEELKSDVEGEDKYVYTDERPSSFALKDVFVDFFISPSEELFCVSEKGKIKRWCLREGNAVVGDERCPGWLDEVEICAADLSCDNVLITLDARKRTVNFYSMGSTNVEKPVLKLEDGKPTCCSFSVDGKKLAIGFKEGFIKLWDVASLDLLTSVATGREEIECVCVSRTGVIGAATPSRVVLVTAVGSVGQARLKVCRVVISPDDTTIVTIDVDGHLHLIDQFDDSNYRSVTHLSRAFSNM